MTGEDVEQLLGALKIAKCTRGVMCEATNDTKKLLIELKSSVHTQLILL